MTTAEHSDQLKQRSGSEEADWFEESFGLDYLWIYQHRDETEAERDDRFVEKTIRLRGRGKEYIERVRLLSARDLESMLDSVGFDVTRRVGDYAGAPWSESSPRTIIFATRR
ncbi:MAG: hypothetical protein ACRENK_10750 [Gemmatimonadaceae bacterium]